MINFDLCFISKAYEGITGPLSFDSTGKRNNYKIDVYRIELNTPQKKASHKN